jgi:hypothetical protein
MISKLKFISIFLTLTFLLVGCRAFTMLNPLEVVLLETTSNTAKFTAQTTDTYRIILEFSRKDISLFMAQCLAGDPGFDKNNFFNPCTNNELPLNVEWEVHSYPENIIIASGKSNPTITLAWGNTNPSGYSVDSVTRRLGTFQVKGGKEYKITAKISNATTLVMSVSPKVVVETPGYFWQ